MAMMDLAASQGENPSSSGNHVKVFIDGPSTRYVKLNVGGSIFQTTLGTLCKYDSMLRTMFSGQIPVLQDCEGFVLIDRCGKHFGTILNFLRQGTVPLPACRNEVEEILCESKYYLLQELTNHCNQFIQYINQVQCEPIGIPRVPIVVCKADVEKILQNSSDRPVIELLMNRQNNKYSYTLQADENFLRNQELFDKLVLRFNNRVLFIKNVGIGSSEICVWIFYDGNGRKKIEICCTSIVYATDRKQTKVEFPEARVYEEAMNALLSTDQELSRLCTRCRNTVPLCDVSAESPSPSLSIPSNTTNLVVEPICSTLRQNLAVEQLNAAKANLSRQDWKTDHNTGTICSPHNSHAHSSHALISSHNEAGGLQPQQQPLPMGSMQACSSSNIHPPPTPSATDVIVSRMSQRLEKLASVEACASCYEDRD
uniref:BTB domain-containing protein n=1 Tax=Ditylenchus dipsaci TaxID=166011 RepID=A0A915CV89_9BILA